MEPEWDYLFKLYEGNIGCTNAIQWAKDNYQNAELRDADYVENFFKPFITNCGKESHACYIYKRGFVQKGFRGLL